MTLEEATRLIRGCADRMNELYQKVVFDEWAVVSLVQHKARIVTYLGPRKEDFQKNFATDVQDLRAELLSNQHSIGDFEFARHGFGTKLEAFVVLGEGLYLICNNTTQSMSTIAKDPLWLSAQVPFVELSDRFRSDPLLVSL
ncbi:MAG TPA: hypothetical protein VEL06_14310 [Haliangiales bacterium]|nr:hypothetical protein [Haliangiales bacterium]